MNIDFNNFTENSRQAITAAHRIARQCSYSSLEPAVLVVAIMQADRDMLPFLLEQMNVDKVPFFTALSDAMQQLPHNGDADAAISFSPATEQVLATAQRLATRSGSNVVALEHILWALYEVPGTVKDVMKHFGITSSKLEAAISTFRNGNTAPEPPRENNESGLPHLRRYATDLVRAAAEGRIEPVIGRDTEVRRLLQILSRKTKNNPILVGEPGTGKTAIVEGLAHRLNQGDVPEELRGMKLFSLDFSGMVAGAGAQGELEERLKKLIEDVKTDPSVVLFIDEIHLLAGGGMDAANILKPEMARGLIKVVGATTLDEYRKYIEKDKAFERRFQKVIVEEPDPETAITIMRGIKNRFEAHHHIKILDEAIVAAVNLSHRYISDRFLPDKAIDLLDEAASGMRLDISSAPVELELLKRRIRDKEVEREAIRQEDPDNTALTALDREIADLKEQENTMNARWRNARTRMQRIHEARQELENMETNRLAAEEQGRYTEALQLQRDAESLRENIEAMSLELTGEGSLLKSALDENDIMRVVTAWTGIPMTNLNREETEKQRNIESSLHSTVVGQDKAVTAVANVIRRNRMGLGDAGKPIGSFLFLGTTGVGKTELCKALAQYLFDSKDMMVRIDMSEYQQEHSVARLFGAPPGYVGYDQGGQLTEAVRRKPYSVVLFDEIEKAHPKVFETLLQVLDDGRMTDGQGRVVDFKNTIIIMTSNMGQDVIMSSLTGNEPSADEIERVTERVTEQLKSRVAPEFLNRIDDTVMFLPLSRRDIAKIAEMQLQRLVEKLRNNDLRLSFDPNVVHAIAAAGYQPEYGGRPVKRAVNELIVNALSLALVEGNLDRNRPIRAIATEQGINFVNV